MQGTPAAVIVSVGSGAASAVGRADASSTGPGTPRVEVGAEHHEQVARG